MTTLIVVLGLALVTLGAELLVRGASALALRMRLSPLFVGLTIVGLGTSTPELGASVTASLAGSTDVSVGNVVGSNLFNLGVILGLTAILRPIRIRLALVRRDVLVAAAAAIVPWIALVSGGRLDAVAGTALLAVLLGYLIIAYRAARGARPVEEQPAIAGVEAALDVTALQGTASDGVRPEVPWWSRPPVSAILVVVGLFCLVAGSRLFVTASIELARGLGVTELVIGLTLVSVGTSLPELVTSVVAALRGSPDIAVGNVLGSNIFNSFGILGTASVITPQVVPGAITTVETPLLLAVTLLLVPFLRTGAVLSRREGAVLVLVYAVYLGSLLGWRGA